MPRFLCAGSEPPTPGTRQAAARRLRCRCVVKRRGVPRACQELGYRRGCAVRRGQELRQGRACGVPSHLPLPQPVRCAGMEQIGTENAQGVMVCGRRPGPLGGQIRRHEGLLYRRFQGLLCQKFQLQRTGLVIHVGIIRGHQAAFRRTSRSPCVNAADDDQSDCSLDCHGSSVRGLAATVIGPLMAASPAQACVPQGLLEVAARLDLFEW